MSYKYPYRFKTKDEFEKQFGQEWRDAVYLQFPSFMDKLLGIEYPYNVDEKDKHRYTELHGYMGYHISWDMLIENDPIKPSYKPKEKVIRSI